MVHVVEEPLDVEEENGAFEARCMGGLDVV